MVLVPLFMVRFNVAVSGQLLASVVIFRYVPLVVYVCPLTLHVYEVHAVTGVMVLVPLFMVRFNVAVSGQLLAPVVIFRYVPLFMVRFNVAVSGQLLAPVVI